MTRDPAEPDAFRGSVVPAVELRRLARRYGGEFVLRDLDLTIAPGRVIVLRGANGAGKTTLLKVLATRLRPSRGSAFVFGHDVSRRAHDVRAAVAYLSVFGGSYGPLTARENLRLAGVLHGRPDDERDARLLDEVGLAHAADKLVRSFSSGMKKRLGLARLLLADARLWLLDEPYAALDEEGKTLVDALLVRARQDGTTVLMASHDLERSSSFADAVLHLEAGRLRHEPLRDPAERVRLEAAGV